MIYTTRKRLLSVFSLVLTSLFVSAPALMAADGDKTALRKWVLDGGWPMILISLAIIALLALSVFNFINLTKQKFCPDDLKAALLDHMMNCRVRSAIELAASHPSYVGRMLAY
ncbi:MAG TPA: MotA/TolQ/ExbB proton channel family protein, partial [Roseibacillus sp.]|nr:MotA/TolQ/ExbB proton channel family protein [Roseibacillus sp.]